VVETELEVPDQFQLVAGHYIYHKVTSGLMPIGTVIYDGKRDVLVACLDGAAYDKTVTIDEWLVERPHWVEATGEDDAPTPFLEMQRIKLAPPDDGD